MICDVKTIDGVRTFTVSRGEAGPHIIWPCQADGAGSVMKLADKAYEESGGLPFTLTAFAVLDWNRELSPWCACIPEAGGIFEGQADQTLAWLERSLIPTCQEKPYLLGYSLAGLFSLWALTQSDKLAGAASCSGSTWFPEWTSYSESATWPDQSLIYLSLGSKEELTHNQVMVPVGENTLRLSKYLKASPSIAACTLEMNRGGHYSDVLGRLAKAIAWLANQDQRKSSYKQ